MRVQDGILNSAAVGMVGFSWLGASCRDLGLTWSRGPGAGLPFGSDEHFHGGSGFGYAVCGKRW